MLQEKSLKKIPKLTFIFGTRPEIIKMFPVIKEAKDKGFSVTTIFTGQHRDLSGPLLSLFNLKATVNLEIMSPNQSLNALSAKLLEKFSSLLTPDSTDLILVQGDTTSAAMGALAGFQNQIPVAHIEAGLRTDTITSPFPEEYNRRLVALSAKLHFAPTEDAAQNLLNEKINSSQIVVTGNTGIDTLLWATSQLAPTKLPPMCDGKKIILWTQHRRESFGLPLLHSFQALKKIAQREDVMIVLPLHPNPKVREIFETVFGIYKPGFVGSSIWVTEPLDYQANINILRQCHFIMTDSGGLQEEGPCLAKPVLVLRDSTERAQGISAQAAKLIGTDYDTLVQWAEKMLNESEEFKTMAKVRMLYGDGLASQRIIKSIAQFFSY